MTKAKKLPTEKEIQMNSVKIRTLANSGQFKKAYSMAFKLKSEHPGCLMYAYWEAVFTAEDTSGMSPSKAKAQYRKATNKLRKLLYRLAGSSPRLAASIRNEYYWFSCQPLKQYRLGVETVKAGDKGGYYPQGVGASQLALQYAMKRQVGPCLRWARVSEKAWLKYFKIVPNWFNSYLFYARALGLQGKKTEMMNALKKICKNFWAQTVKPCICRYSERGRKGTKSDEIYKALNFF